MIQRVALLQEVATRPHRFDLVKVAIPKSEEAIYEEQLRFHPTENDWMGVARVISREPGAFLGFEVVETLDGAAPSPFEAFFSEEDGA